MLEAREQLVALLKARGRALIEVDVRKHLVGMLKGRAIATRDAQHFAEFPEGYYVGQEYVECTILVPCTIEALFVYAGAIAPMSFWYLKNHVSMRQFGPYLRISLTRKIAQRLWDDVKNDLPWGIAHECIGAYVDAVLPEINRRLLMVRYDQGHLLSRTFNAAEATNVVIRRGPDIARVRWPRPIAAFPPSLELASSVKHVYVRELIDAMHAFLRGEYDECVRRVITSTEDFIRARGWNTTPRSGFVNRVLVALRFRSARKRCSFRQSLTTHVDGSTLPGSTLVSNLFTIYEVRNRIVHGGLRLHSSAKLFCHKAVSTLRYLIQYFCEEDATARFVHSLEMQLIAVMDLTAGFDLDDAARMGLESDDSQPPIDTAHDALHAIFQSLRFDGRDIRAVS